MASMSKGSIDKKKEQPRSENGPSATTDIPAVSRTLGSIRPERESQAIPTKAISNVTASSEGLSASVTRHGAPKMTFLPKRPVRRNLLPDQTPQPSPLPEGGGRGRGRGLGRGSERGRGTPTVGRGETLMVASGPFSLGPAAAGSSTSYGRRSQTTSSTVGLRGIAATSLGTGLTNNSAPTLGGKGSWDDDMDGNLSNDEGVEKVDMDHVAKLDWNAPVALQREDKKLKARAGSPSRREKEETVDISNALDLSESDDGGQPEDLVEYFTTRNLENSDVAQGERLFIFQFPSPFPTFIPANKILGATRPDDGTPSDGKGKGKAVSWASDLKEEDKPHNTAGTESSAKAVELDNPAEGTIGRLEIYKSGAVKMRLNGNLVMDVIPGTQPAFLQSAVYFDRTQNRLGVLGDIKKRFVVFPDVDMLLSDFEETKEEVVHDPLLDGLEPMHIDVDS